MKKFLSLVLALVMTMSLVTIAGAKDFTDAAEINYKEAVDVMSALKIVDGTTDGAFNPDGTLTRGAAAKIICNLILGPTTAEDLVAVDAPYSDVASDNVFAGYIAYCAKEGIISGGMIPKVDCCIEAIGHGVKNVVIMDGRIPHSILMELLTDEGAGTMVTEG